MQQVIQIQGFTLPVEKQCDPNEIKDALRLRYGIEGIAINSLQIKKKSIDARKKSNIVHHLQLDISLSDARLAERLLQENPKTVSISAKKKSQDPLGEFSQEDLLTLQQAYRSNENHRPVIIGTGPAGIFAGLTLARAGLRPILIERGQAVEQRLRKVNILRAKGEFDPESNYCFGEGGAGTFSDGKLTCGRNHPLVRHLFDVWVRYGAPKDIQVDAHPHIGTDNLLLIAKNMRESMESLGAEFRFETKLESCRSDQGLWTLELSSKETLLTKHVILAVGHSARDTYTMLEKLGVAMQQKPFAMGARIEHPQAVIDNIQYGSCTVLPAAEYKLAAQQGDRGIWTFCMCPGGHLMPTGAQPGHLAINGMSYHARNSQFANAAVVVNVRREDYDKGQPLDGMRYQAKFERKAFAAGGSNYYAPAQRLVDFIEGKPTTVAMKSTYKPGIKPARMDKILPPFIVESLKEAMKAYNNKMRGYLHPDALIVGLESKTSAPVVLPRTKGLESQSHPGLYPCGEGAGFAGGIVSASLDGAKVGKALVQQILESLRTSAN